MIVYKNLIYKIKFASLFIILSTFNLSAQLPSYLPTNGLVAWYPFNGNANDESGNGTNGIVNGPTLAPNRFGQSNSAYSFDGINDFIQYPQGSNTPINIVGDISFGYWVKTTSTDGIITSFGDQLAGQGGYLSGLRDGSAEPSPGRLGYWVGGTWITSSALINDNNWTFIMVTYTGGQLKLYVNGNLDSQHSGMPAASWNGNRTLGKPNYVDVRFFSGLLDDFVIYSRALSASEINSLYNANSGNNTTNTVNPAPPGIPYQAEVRNESGEVLANANVNVRFTLHELTANGTVSYQETSAITTNELGLFAATIGAGTAAQGTFAGINWSQTTKFLQVEVDAGNGYITMGNQQLMSVPYALYAANGPAGPMGPAGADGQPGPQGEPGASGIKSLIKSEIEPPGSNCIAGGVKIEVGLDINKNGILEMSELNSDETFYICNGINENSNINHSQFETFDVFSTPGQYNWTVPENITKIMVECWGAGAGGGWNSVSGGAGGYGKSIFTVTPGQVYTLTIGAGGFGMNYNGAYQPGTSGGNTSFGDNMIISYGGTTTGYGNGAGTGIGGQSSGQINIQGGSGSGRTGGTAPLGGAGGSPGDINGKVPGGGGAGTEICPGCCGAGASGRIIIHW